MELSEVPERFMSLAWHAAERQGSDVCRDGAIREKLAAVLTDHEQHLRERIAAELKQKSHRVRSEAEKASCTRDRELRGESLGYWMAARDVLDGIGSKPTCQSSRVTPAVILNCARVQDHAGQHRTAGGERWGSTSSTPIQGSGYTPLQLLGVVQDDDEEVPE